MYHMLNGKASAKWYRGCQRSRRGQAREHVGQPDQPCKNQGKLTTACFINVLCEGGGSLSRTPSARARCRAPIRARIWRAWAAQRPSRGEGPCVRKQRKHKVPRADSHPNRATSARLGTRARTMKKTYARLRPSG